PGVIVDRYGDYFVLQTLTLAMDSRKDLIVKAIVDLFRDATIIERNDSPVRKAEGLELITGVLESAAPTGPIEIEVGDLKFDVDLLHAQKTGFYLDQLPNYSLVANHAADRRVLDCFANQGAFALACAQAGATDVAAVEENSENVAAGKRNAERNGLKVRWIE